MIAAESRCIVGGDSADQQRSGGDEGCDHRDLPCPVGGGAGFGLDLLGLLPHRVDALFGFGLRYAGGRGDLAGQILPVAVFQRAVDDRRDENAADLVA
jgi:hypothetical protein